MYRFDEASPFYGFRGTGRKEEARIMRDKFAFSVSALEILDSAFILGAERDIDARPSIGRGKFK